MKDKGNRVQGVHSRKTRKQVFKIFLIQAILSVVIASALLLHDRVTAWSSLLGAGLYLLPNLYFADRALTFTKGQTAGRALAEMYVSQMWKMGISILAFAAVFILIQPLNPFSLFGTFILLQITAWLAQMKVNSRFLKL